MRTSVSVAGLSRKPLTKICSASSAYSGCSVTAIRLQRGWIFCTIRAIVSPFIPGISRFRKAASIGLCRSQVSASSVVIALI